MCACLVRLAVDIQEDRIARVLTGPLSFSMRSQSAEDQWKYVRRQQSDARLETGTHPIVFIVF